MIWFVFSFNVEPTPMLYADRCSAAVAHQLVSMGVEKKMKLTACIFLSLSLLSGCSSPHPSVNRKPVIPQTTANNLAKHKKTIQQYFEVVDMALIAELPKGKIDRMTRSPWQDKMQKQFQNGDPTRVGIELWSETNPSNNVIRLRVRCNVLGLDQIPIATIEPTLSIPVQERGIRLDWYISTGNKLLDERFAAIAGEKAEFFKQNLTRDGLKPRP